jgi:hypothetical protein
MDWHTMTINNYMKDTQEKADLDEAAENEASRYMDSTDPLYDKFVDYLAKNVDYDYDYDSEGYFTIWPSYESFMEKQEED